MNKRIEWVDIAKAIAMFCVVIGHSCGRNTLVWNWVYSFHMPMFFILGGYTIKRPNTFFELLKGVKLKVRRLLIPVILIEMVRILCTRIFNGVAIKGQLIEELQKLIWASGATNLDNSILPLGGCWFLIAMFYGKILFEFFLLVFERHALLPSLLLGMIGAALGNHHYLPQEMDVCMLVVAFLSIGYEMRNYNLENKTDLEIHFIGIVGMVIWMVCFAFGIRIEIAWRDVNGK